MTQQTSPTTGQVYPIGMACRVLGVARSSYYASRQTKPAGIKPAKRGPKTALSDEALCVEIKRVIDECPFHGEGHRKVRARLVAQDIQVGRNRVLRLMRLKGWLAPVRAGNPHGPKAHDGRIITDRPDDMWGADATRFYTRRDGWCWWFGAVDHYTDEVMGWATAKIGELTMELELHEKKGHCSHPGGGRDHDATDKPDHGPGLPDRDGMSSAGCGSFVVLREPTTEALGGRAGQAWPEDGAVRRGAVRRDQARD